MIISIKIKRIWLVLFLGIFGLAAKSQAQNCPSQRLVLTTQNMVDSFPINYPGCENVDFGMDIMGNQIHNLDSLYPIKKIGVELNISNTTFLKSLSGLSNLDSVVGNFELRDNDSLWGLNGLGSLKYVGSNFRIIGNPRLKELKGPSQLNYVGHLRILLNSNLDSLVGIESISHIGWGTGKLQIMNNGSLKSMIGLENLSCENLQIWQNDSLENLLGLENNVLFEGLSLQGNAGLKTLQGLEGIKSIAGVLHIGGSHNLETIEALSGLRSVGASVSIAFCSSLKDLKGLDSLRSTGTLEINRLPSLKNLQHLNKLNRINGELIIAQNDSLWNLNGLDSLKNILTDCSIIDNRSLVSLDGIESLESIDGSLKIHNDSVLSNLLALRNLSHVESQISILRNSNLSSLKGLDSVNGLFAGLWKLSIYRNPLLTACTVQSICDYLSLGKLSEVFDNATGCNDTAEIALQCQSISIIENESVANFDIYPNPNSGNQITVKLGAQYSIPYTLKLQNVLGQEIMNFENQIERELKLDMENMPSGVYLVIVQDSNKQVKTQKLNNQ